MKRLFSLILLTSVFLTACGVSTTPTPVPAAEALTLAPAVALESRTLTVFAAASLTDAFTEIGAAFDATNPGVTTIFNFAGSQALRTQIEEGAPADVFASASGREMNSLVTGAFVGADEALVFLTNKLVIILPSNNPAGLEKLEDLAKPGLKLVLAAEEVPIGKYARQALELMNGAFGTDFKDKVLENIVSNEDNVKQVVAKIQLGEADAGIVYASDSIAMPNLESIEIPTELNIVAEYPIAPLTKSVNKELAVKFTEFVLSIEGQDILAKWGFFPVQ